MDRPAATPRQLARLVEEVSEVGLDWSGTEPWHAVAVLALDYARRPAGFERRTPSFGAIIAPTTDPGSWAAGTGLDVDVRLLGDEVPWMTMARLFADGLSSWIVLDPGDQHATAVFDRPAGSERDLVVIASTFGATVVQRHPSGMVRVVGPAGVHRWDGMSWHHEAPLASWVAAIVATCAAQTQGPALEHLVEFALHDLAARNIGATLIYRPGPSRAGGTERRFPTPPSLPITHPPALAPLRHALAQVDGATMFDADGVLREIGVRLIPSPAAEAGVEALRGMRHTAARRYSHDDPQATVIVVSESGTVTVMRGGIVVGVSAPPDDVAALD